jgi:hypothetical protein
MIDAKRLREEYDRAVRKKQELSESLRKMERTDPTNLSQIWIIRDQIAYWEGKSEGLKLALDELSR